MPGIRRTLLDLLHDRRGAAVALEALIAIPAFAGIIALGAHLHERESSRSVMAREVRREAWGLALGSCQAMGGAISGAGAALGGGSGALVEAAAQESFGVGLEAALSKAKLSPHLGEADVTLHPRYAATRWTREVTRPVFLGGGASQISSRIGVACNTVTRVRAFKRELHDVFKHFQFLYGG